MEKLEPKHIETILALTPLQEGILFHYLQEPLNRHYFEQLSLGICGTVVIENFEKAWNVVIKANEMLRTIFQWEKLDRPSQVILKKHTCEIKFYNLVEIECSQKEMVLKEIKEKDQHESFELRRVPFRVILFKLAETQYEMVVSNHHILYDGWSNGIILREFFNVYHELCHPGRAYKIPTKPSFKEFIKWLQKQDKNKREQFWREYLAGFERPTELPIKKRSSASIRPGDYSFTLGEEIPRKAEAFVKNNRVTLASVFYTAWGILLQKYCRSGDIIFGTTVSGRSANVKGIEDMVGLFINTVPFRINALPGEKIIDVVSRTDQFLREREEFEHTPLVNIQGHGSVAGGGSLFDTILAIENYPLDSRLLPADSLLSVKSHTIIETTHYDLSVGIMPFNEIEINFNYKQECFARDAIENLAGHFKKIIQTLIDYPEIALSQVEIISIEEKNRILNEFNNTTAEYPADKTIHQLFTEKAVKIPDHIAIFGCGQASTTRTDTDKNVETLRATSLQIQMSYRQLNEQSDRLARLLIEKGVLPDNIVGIMMERSVEMIIGIMGILKSGGAYLPIDPGHPQERIDYMLNDSNVKLSINYEFLMEAPQAPLHYSSFINHHSNLAYIIYTSGSTGKPKGVLIRHQGVANYIYWLKSELNLHADTHFLTLADYTFDASVMDIFGSLLHGAVLFVGEKDLIFNRVYFKEYVKKNRISMVVFIPRVLDELLCNEEKLPPLQTIVVGGEELTPSIKDRILEKGYSLFNHYGPTEITVDALATKCSGKEVTLGKPIANSQCHIIGEASLAPVGLLGEICISGVGLAMGYLNQPELTAEKFTKNPFLSGQRMYRTGDLGRWTADGEVEFAGRMDHQVKIRGVRIELAEIENRLRKNPQVKDAVVIIDKSIPTAENLIAFVETQIPQIPGEKPGVETEPLGDRLRQFLEKELPAYMIPMDFIEVDKMPLTPNGKLNRKALLLVKTGVRKPPVTVNYEGPGNEAERILVGIWQELLGIEKIGIHDDFFKLGGNSILLIRLFSQLNRRFPKQITVQDLFDNRTVKKLARVIMASNENIKDPSINKIRNIDF